LMLGPTGIGVGDQAIRRLQDRARGTDPLDVLVRIAPDLQLEARVALLAVAGDLTRHFVRRLLRDGPIQRHALAEAAAQEDTDRQVRGLTEKVPAGDVDARLDVGMAL